MKQVFWLIFALGIVSCNLPASEGTQIVPEAPSAVSTSTFFTSTALPLTVSSETPNPPTSTSTTTPIPCDPSTADYCIVDGTFIFQRPIQPPDNDRIDLTYAYASTQNGKRDPHHGVEFQNAFGTPVYAAGEGEVVFADADKTTKFSPWTNFYGNVVIIQHDNDMYTLYAHLSSILVRAGDKVVAGAEIGQVGATGGATGSHLHFEVRTGSDYTDYFSTQNPELWLIPPQGTGALSITLKTSYEQNYERPLVITRYANESDEPVYTYYISTYAKGFEFNFEDAVLSSLPPGKYKIAFSDVSGLKERFVFVEEGRLTEVVFDLSG